MSEEIATYDTPVEKCEETIAPVFPFILLGGVQTRVQDQLTQILLGILPFVPLGRRENYQGLGSCEELLEARNN